MTDEAIDGPALAALVEAAGVPGTPVHDRAQRLLGLSPDQAKTLFDSDLDADWLHVVVERLHASDRPVIDRGCTGAIDRRGSATRAERLTPSLGAAPYQSSCASSWASVWRS